eukprot:TRINITY_DN10329_c0_g1_i1.p1 TRINITY_DN10329_c0_g1~~TRINITY_DN10329_c0_g1_i1.p1  ORF type:complete len:248 (-),score=47.65 TRINITY_DN10329_c0_g1_i1:68-811(-)
MSLAHLQRAIYDQERMYGRCGTRAPSPDQRSNDTIELEVETCQKVQNLVTLIRHNFSDLLSSKSVITNDPEISNSVSYLFSRVSELESIIIRSNLNVSVPLPSFERDSSPSPYNYYSSSSSVSSPDSSPRQPDLHDTSLLSFEPQPAKKISKRKSEEIESDPSNSSLFNSECKLKMRRTRAKQAPTVTGQLSCRACGETKTCEWRRGPDGYKSLCNACGIHYAKIVKKEESTNYVPKALSLNHLLNN